MRWFKRLARRRGDSMCPDGHVYTPKVLAGAGYNLLEPKPPRLLAVGKSLLFQLGVHVPNQLGVSASRPPCPSQKKFYPPCIAVS